MGLVRRSSPRGSLVGSNPVHAYRLSSSVKGLGNSFLSASYVENSLLEHLGFAGSWAARALLKDGISRSRRSTKQFIRLALARLQQRLSRTASDDYFGICLNPN